MEDARSTGRIGGTGDDVEEDLSGLGGGITNEVVFEFLLLSGGEVGEVVEVLSCVVGEGFGHGVGWVDLFLSFSGVNNGDVGIV